MPRTRDRADRADRAGSGLPAPEPTERQKGVRTIAQSHLSGRGPLLPILHAVVERYGFIDEDDIPIIADVVNVSRADVLGVVSFYPDFRRTPPAEHVITLCRAEACQSVGGAGLYAATHERYSHSEDVEVREVFCLGNCALGPAGVINGLLHGRLTADAIATALEDE